MSKHTPGPWKIREGYGLLMAEIGPSDRAIATVWVKRYATPEGQDKQEPVEWSEGQANARLIAAAPDQNKALHVAITVWRDVMGDMRCLVGAEAIIYKRMENALRVMEAAIAKAKEEA